MAGVYTTGQRVALFLVVLAAGVLMLGPLWWWAIFGMSENVGVAWLWTVIVGEFVLLGVGIFIDAMRGEA